MSTGFTIAMNGIIIVCLLASVYGAYRIINKANTRKEKSFLIKAVISYYILFTALFLGDRFLPMPYHAILWSIFLTVQFFGIAWVTHKHQNIIEDNQANEIMASSETNKTNGG